MSDENNDKAKSRPRGLAKIHRLRLSCLPYALGLSPDALLEAIYQSQSKRIKALLDYGADPNKVK